jgi:hypothetical protein
LLCGDVVDATILEQRKRSTGGQQSRSQVIGLGAQEYRVLEAMDERKTVAEIEQIASERGPQCDGASFIASMLELGVLGDIETGRGA